MAKDITAVMAFNTTNEYNRKETGKVYRVER